MNAASKNRFLSLIQMLRLRPRWFAAVVAWNLVLVCVLGELGTRFVRFDLRIVRPLLTYQGADVEVHMPSDDPELLYQLKPGAVLDTQTLPGEPRRVTINTLGFRGPERQASKPPGVFRIVILGSSNTYGPDVNDEDTYPAQLERLLNERGGPSSFEVWNGGICAYVPVQIVRRARYVLDNYEPDLLILQLYMPGRRAFVQFGPGRKPWSNIPLGRFQSWFDRNPELYWENLELIPFPRWAAARWLFLHSNFYRTLVITANRVMNIRNNPDFETNAFSDRALAQFAHDQITANFGLHAGGPTSSIKIVKMGMNPAQHACGPAGLFPELFEREREPPSDFPREQYLHVHPPPFAYRWVAKELRDELTDLRLIPLESNSTSQP